MRDDVAQLITKGVDAFVYIHDDVIREIDLLLHNASDALCARCVWEKRGAYCKSAVRIANAQCVLQKRSAFGQSQCCHDAWHIVLGMMS